MKYIIMPFLACIVAGVVKYSINYIRFGNKANKLIGYGGFPSTHTTIISSVVFLYGFSNGFENGIFSMGLGFLLITVIDAHGLRKKVGEQAKIINSITKNTKLREKMGHTWFEIFGGLCLGIILAFCMEIFS